MPEYDVSRLKTPAEYRSDRASLFPSEGALAWFTRRHREHLIAAKALVAINRRVMVDVPNFDRAVFEVGQARMAEAA